MSLKIKTNSLNNFKQYVIPFFKTYILIGKSPNLFYVRFGETKKGFQITSKPLFSVRNGHKKSFKFKRYYISKL